MAVPESEHPAVIVAGFAALDDFHDAEIAVAVVCEAVGLAADLQVRGGQCALNGIDRLTMWDRVLRQPGASRADPSPAGTKCARLSVEQRGRWLFPDAPISPSKKMSPDSGKALFDAQPQDYFYFSGGDDGIIVNPTVGPGFGIGR